MNGEYLKAMPLEDRTELVRRQLIEQGHWSAEETAERNAWLAQIVAALGERLKLTTQFMDYADCFLREDLVLEEPALEALSARPRVREILSGLETLLRAHTDFTVAALEPPVRALAAELGVKAGDVINVARAALTGKKIGPGIFDVMVLLGKERCLERLRNAEEALRSRVPSS